MESKILFVIVASIMLVVIGGIYQLYVLRRDIIQKVDLEDRSHL